MNQLLLTQARHCDQLATILTEQGPENYSHLTWMSIGFVHAANVARNTNTCAPTACKTTACAMGWAAHHNIGGLKLVVAQNGDIIPRIRPGVSVVESANEVFGANAYDRIFSMKREVAPLPGFDRINDIVNGLAPSKENDLYMALAFRPDLRTEYFQYSHALSIARAHEQAATLRMQAQMEEKTASQELLRITSTVLEEI